jgi:transcriptional regulator with XRE-family HTH domain
MYLIKLDFLNYLKLLFYFYCMAFSENIKKLRKDRGWTQEQASDKLGIKMHNLGAYEEGRARPPLDVLKKFVELYKPKNVRKFLFDQI